MGALLDEVRVDNTQCDPAIGDFMGKPYRKYIIWSLVVQMFLFLLASMALDFGETFFVFAYSAVAYWIGVAIIIRRKANEPIRTDVLYLKYGLILLSMVSCILSPMIWALRGKW